MVMQRIAGVTAAFAILVLVGPAKLVGQQPASQPAAAAGRGQQGPPQMPLLNPEHVRMQPEDPFAGTGNNRIFGNPSQPGYYITLNRYAPNATTRPHFHDKDRWVTVIKGTWYTGEGKIYRPETMVPIKQGGIMFHPAGFIHYDGSRDGQEVVLYIAGMGPVMTTQAEEDEQGHPVARPAAR